MFKDQIGHSFKLEKPAERVVCLVPSITELIYQLKPKALIGVTSFCTHPSHLRKNITVVGGTKTPNVEQIISLNPNLVICNKEENTEQDVLHLQKCVATYTSDVKTLTEAQKMIADVGQLLGRSEECKVLNQEIELGFSGLQTQKPFKVAYLIWDKPLMVAGNNTFINHMINQLNWQNVFANKPDRYFEINREDLINSKADLILLSSEPYPFKEKNKKQFEKEFPEFKTVLVDGRMFSWYGSCLVSATKYFNQLTKYLNRE